MKKSMIFAYAFLLILFVGTLNATTMTESGDTGELLSTAQIASGTGILDSIEGILISPYDIDLFGFFINDPNAFSVTVTSYLTGDHDSMLWLFDSAGLLILSDDDGGGGSGKIPKFNAGELSGHAAGLYYLGFSLFYTVPAGYPSTNPLTLTGWDPNPDPLQSGSYRLDLTGAGSPAPEPATMLLLGLGLLGMAGVGRRRM